MRLRWSMVAALVVLAAGCQSEWQPEAQTLETYPVVAQTEPAPEAPGVEGWERFLPGGYLARSEAQCATVLKEIAFCSEEDVFLATLGQTEALSDEAARGAFLAQVERWYTPGNAREDCRRIVEATRFPGAVARQTWRAAAEGSARVCAEFGQVLVQSGFLERMGESIWGAR
ncbi:hypothetical protein FRC96_00775 [Lujinxingia vulgaris]|uniref:Lipoprotein n=1 Tax=Lujinxingia vulgaris TaxID=2600176 RepID=A0A5C6XM99_9DELT|nr:hypothetical protein [Lujinxingia vulgaris]TXD44255.1 hypothetical protein FRC96_00775 [Lujinxingia vulgaris]